MPKGDRCEDGDGSDDEYDRPLGPTGEVLSVSCYLSASQALSHLIATPALCVDDID